jgi:hypothetical protein
MENVLARFIKKMSQEVDDYHFVLDIEKEKILF